MAGKPAFQFYPGDWAKDPKLRSCEPATRGIWVDLLCAMWNNEATFVRGTVRDLARICGCFPDEMAAAIRDLDVTGTADVAYDGDVICITSRRFVKDSQRRADTYERVKKHRACNADVTAKKRACTEDEEEVEEEEEERREEEQDDFAEAWDAYGKKVAKAAAERAWRRLNRGDRAAALARIPDYVAATPDVQYRANFATWLNGRRWEDEAPKNGAAPTLSSPAACAGCGDALGVDFTRYQSRAYCDECYEARAWAKQEA